MVLVINCILLVFTLWSWPAIGWSDERAFLHGEIQKLDQDKLIMTIREEGEGQAGRLVRVALPQAVLTAAGDARLPDCLAVGRHVRVWGTAYAVDSSSFTADDVRGCTMAECGDPTGVRSRLFRHRKEKRAGDMCR